ncbi:MAG: DNA methyltransferase [Eubacteriales bacterium]
MRELLATQPIYESQKLQRFFLSLESRYRVESAREKYHNLVNFSANASVPYHQWFAYREGFSAQLITQLIAMSGCAAGEMVLDPFCGSGTTNVVAALSGYPTLGMDVNPMSAFLTQAKVSHYREEDLQKALDFARQSGLWESGGQPEAYEEVRKYFQPWAFEQLLRIKGFLDTLPFCPARDLLFVAYLSIVVDCSDRKRDGNGLKKRPSKVTNVAEYFRQKVQLIVEDIRSQKGGGEAAGYGVHDTAFHLRQRFEQCRQGADAGVIIFSPPYANSFDYFESYKLELVLGDFVQGLAGIGGLRQQAVRSFVGARQQESCDPYVDALAREIEEAIPRKEQETGKKDSRTRKVPGMIRGYFSDMREVIHQCGLCLERGKKTYIVVDQSAYVGKIVPTDLLFGYLGEQEGFSVGRIIECRKARTSTQQLSRYPFLKTALRESIVELIKT